MHRPQNTNKQEEILQVETVFAPRPQKGPRGKDEVNHEDHMQGGFGTSLPDGEAQFSHDGFFKS